MFCGKCGTQLNEGAKFCRKCGAAALAGQQAAPPSPGPQPATYMAPPPQTAPAKQAGALEGDLRRELLGRWNWKILTVIAACAALMYLLMYLLYGSNAFWSILERGMGRRGLGSQISGALYTALPIVLCGLCGALPASIAAIACPLAVGIADFGFRPYLLVCTISNSIFAASVCSAPFLGLRPARGVMPGAKLAIYAAILFAGNIISFYAYLVSGRFLEEFRFFKPASIFRYISSINVFYVVTPYCAVVFVGIAAALSVLWCIAARYRKQRGTDGTRRQA